MGAEACVVGFGPYAPDLDDILPYGPSAYDNVRLGQPVLVELFPCPTTSISDQLADALGSELWDFSKHKIEHDKVEWEMLGEMHKEHAEWLDTLLCRGFTMMLQPNG